MAKALCNEEKTLRQLGFTLTALNRTLRHVRVGFTNEDTNENRFDGDEWAGVVVANRLGGGGKGCLGFAFSCCA